MTAAAAGSSLFTGNHVREFFARRLAWHTARRVYTMVGHATCTRREPRLDAVNGVARAALCDSHFAADGAPEIRS